MNSELQIILKGVSRSFYLSIRLLPKRIRPPIELAFLFCKAADTIADTEIVPVEERLKKLEEFCELFRGGRSTPPQASSEPLLKQTVCLGPLDQVYLFAPTYKGEGSPEVKLLNFIPNLFLELKNFPESDQKTIFNLVSELTQGMEWDLKKFPSNQLTSLQDEVELNQYTYYVAGCVGRFWSRMIKNHYSFAKDWGETEEACGESFGKGLQMVNILRDLPRDLQKGRCYIPTDLLQKYNLTPKDLIQDPSSRLDWLALGLERDKGREGLFKELLEKTFSHLNQGKKYISFLPWYARRLRATVQLPMILGFQTLSALKNSMDRWLDPTEVIKVPRRKVYADLFAAFFT